MPEMTAMPILPSAAPPASSSSVSSGLVARQDKTSNSTLAANSAGSSSEPGAVNNDKNSFASVLQRQMAQAMPVPLPDATALLDVNAKALPDATALLDVNAKALPDATALLDVNAKALPDATALLDVNAKALPDVAALLDANAKALPDAATLLDADAKALPDATALLDADGKALLTTTKEASLSSDKSDDKTSLVTSDNGLAASSPYLIALANSPSIKLATNSPNLPMTEKKPAAATEDGLPLALATPLQSQLADAKDAPPSKLAEAPQTTANKPAEFAAGLGVSPDAVPTHTKQGESASAETSFENMLAAAQAAGQHRNSVVHSPSQSATSLPVQTPVGTRGWDGEVGDKLVWMVGRQEQRAELVLNPPQLGRIEVSLSMSGGQTSALFVSANPLVRDALEAALPRLREILADAGVNLGQTQVGADSNSNQASNQSTNNRENWDNFSRGANRFDLASDSTDLLRPVGTSQWIRQSNSLVDVFA